MLNRYTDQFNLSKIKKTSTAVVDGIKINLRTEKNSSGERDD